MEYVNSSFICWRDLKLSGTPSGARISDDSRVRIIKLEKMRNKYFNDTTNNTLLELTKTFEGAIVSGETNSRRF